MIGYEFKGPLSETSRNSTLPELLLLVIIVECPPVVRFTMNAVSSVTEQIVASKMKEVDFGASRDITPLLVRFVIPQMRRGREGRGSEAVINLRGV